MSTETKKTDLKQVYTHDFHDGAKISPMEITKWHSQVYSAIEKGAPHYSIASGNSFVYGFRSSFENRIVIFEFTNGYYKYEYPQPEMTNQSMSEPIITTYNTAYNQAIQDAIDVVVKFVPGNNVTNLPALVEAILALKKSS